MDTLAAHVAQYEAICARVGFSLHLSMLDIPSRPVMTIGYRSVTEALQLSVKGWRYRICREIQARFGTDMRTHGRYYHISLQTTDGDVVIGADTAAPEDQLQPLHQAIKLSVLQMAPNVAAIVGVSIKGALRTKVKHGPTVSGDRQIMAYYKPLMDYYLSNPGILISDDDDESEMEANPAEESAHAADDRGLSDEDGTDVLEEEVEKPPKKRRDH